MILCKSLEKSKKIKELNISKNNIDDTGAKFISNFILENLSLKALYLHWNNIT